MFLPGGQDIVGAVEEAVLNVVVQWMGLPTRRRQRGWFVTIVADVLGPEALTLDWGWSMYTDFRPWYLVKSNKVYKARTLRRSDASGFEQALRSHPITKADTIEGRLYRTYRGLLDGSLSPSNTMTPISVDPTAWGRLCTMLERCLVYVQDRPSITNEGFQGKLIDDADYYLAFREHAPSRVQTRSTIFHSSTIRTNVGIFSAVVWRGITYRTPFATNHRQVFKSYNDFIDTIRSVVNDDLTTPTTEDDSYFCRGDAYGSRNPNRSIQNASAYWKTITKRHWPRMAASNPTFQECWQWFRPAKQKDHDRLFPQLGDLGSYLLTADLAYANVCQFPTVDELASAIVELNKGAMNGLKRLGFIRGRERSKKDKVAVVSEALRSLDALIRESFGKDDLNEAGYDLICLEHILCKFQRTYKLRDM
ncbi:hypothetical protein CC2G_008407 [Coprinopsis cinerea AmutBmut pab1-1]|nr:hypothetical protein CC2G_008407 [Coprinopsis cinerea AmutBmut pab1-1]